MMKQRRTEEQMKLARDEETYKKEKTFWNSMPFAFRMESFKIQEKLEQNKETKSLTYKVLFDVTH